MSIKDILKEELAKDGAGKYKKLIDSILQYEEDRRKVMSALWNIERESERKKVKETLSSADMVIELQMEKLKALLDHKRGLMQELLPGPGGVKAKLRFP